ncbi:MAG: ThuA domain-containing protein [Verrucomicrobiota bacterium]
MCSRLLLDAFPGSGTRRIARRWFGLVLLAGVASLAAHPVRAEEAKLRVLILSGANNHKWQETTPAIKATLEESGRFSVDVENNVAGMKPEAFAPYAVVLSDFNLFGKDKSLQVWDAAMRKALLDHLGQGHGLVIVHAGSSVFYDWPEFQKLACGAWQDATSHGAIHIDRVAFTAEPSPITAGLAPFWIRDEFWHNAGVAAGAKALATVAPPNAATPNATDPANHNNILFTTESGGARGFAIFLGHDATAMKNTAWRTLLQRGTEWAATHKVTLPPAKDWPASQADAERMAK